MGCNTSKQAVEGMHPDDSVHAALAHEQRIASLKGEKVHGYVPRASHPLLAGGGGGATIQASEEDEEEESASVNSRQKLEEEEATKLLFHSANHNDTVDPRDLELCHEQQRHLHLPHLPHLPHKQQQQQ